jgi:hypothetical protein
MTKLEEIKSAISHFDKNLLDECLKSVISSDIDEKDKLKLLDAAMDLACDAKKFDLILNIFNFVKEHAISFRMKELFQEFNSNHAVWQAVNPELFNFLKTIHAPYISQEFSRLGLEIEDDLLDIITQNVMDFPVILHNQAFNFNTLDTIDVNNNGERVGNHPV